MANLNAIAESLIWGHVPKVGELVQEALDEGVPVQEILDEGLIGGMDVVGEKFKNNEFFVPEALIAGRAMKVGMALIQPKLSEQQVKPLGKVSIGTVKGDLHDIGKNLVAMMLEGAGFEVVDLGIGVPPKRFVESAAQEGAQIVCMSALLTTTMPAMKTTMDALKEAGLSGRIRTMVGGAPITQAYAEQIGADGYAADAASAANRAKELVAELKG